MMILLDSIKLFLKPHSVQKNITLFSLLLFLFFAIYLALSWGITSVSVIPQNQLVINWTENKEPFNEKKWKVAVNILESAIADNPGNAKYYFKLGALYDWYAYQNPIWKALAISQRKKAALYYKKSLEHQPTWSSAWVHFAMSKTLGLEFDDEVKVALSNAMSYGPWERGVFHKVLWISLANWKGLPITLQEQVKARIKETVNEKGRVPKYIQQTATHFQWQDELKEVIKQVLSHKS